MVPYKQRIKGKKESKNFKAAFEREKMSQSQRLGALRTRLVSFDYHEPIGFDSLELVDRIFGDLVSTTEVMAVVGS